MADDGSRDPIDSDRELRQARGALQDARLLYAGDGSVDGVVNRLYYACFHAARAALYDRGEEPTSHGAVRTLFGQRVVLEGAVPREFGRLLRDLYDHRIVADYEGRTPAVDVDALLDGTDQFVRGIEALVE